MASTQGTYGASRSALGSFLQQTIEIVGDWLSDRHQVTRQVMVGGILAVALVAFELFNFDTTEYALQDLLGAISFGGVYWATILAIAFCGIDFAGLARLLTMNKGDRPGGRQGFLKATWLLLAAWLLGGGMNAVMTWWAVSLALVGHDLGNEVLTRGQLLRMVPIFVALLVWVTRILIISSFTMTTDQALREAYRREKRPQQSSAGQPKPVRDHAYRAPAAGQPKTEPVYVGSPMRRPNGQPRGRAPQRPASPRPPRGVRPVHRQARSGRDDSQLM